MHVYVHFFGRHGKIDDISGEPALRQSVLVAQAYGVLQALVTDRPPVDEQRLQIALIARRGDRRDPAVHPQATSLLGDRQRGLLERGAVQTR